MSEDTFAQESNDGGEESSVIKTLRKEQAKAQAEAKRLAEELQGLQAERGQIRSAQLEAAVNGRNYPDAVVAALKAQVETASSDEFTKLLQDLGSLGGETEGVEQPTEEAEVPPTPQANPADIGQQLAAAAAGGGGEVNVVKDLLSAATQEELWAKAADHGLDKF